jgi:hypothetical protein
MENNETEEIDSVRGLMDSQRVAVHLGVARGTIRSWASRKSAGSAGVPVKFPDPLPEQLGGTLLWDVETIRAFKKVFDADREEESRKKGTKKGASDVLHAVESKHD